jgi:hypothetical protein
MNSSISRCASSELRGVIETTLPSLSMTILRSRLSIASGERASRPIFQHA